LTGPDPAPRFPPLFPAATAAIPAKKVPMSKAVTDASFETDVLKSAGPVVVDFWAEWCGPCRQIAPALEEISTELNGRVTIAKLNVDENPVAPSRYGVRGIPTLILFKGGQVAATKVGALPKNKLKEWIESMI
jgi:thioredoxin 1